MITKEYKNANGHVIWEVPNEELAAKCDRWMVLNTDSGDTWAEWDELDEELKEYKTLDTFM